MNENLDVISMLLLGLLGSGHCLGMCGPLVIALPGQFGRWSAHLLYHLGRLCTYTLMGFLMGGLGSGWSPSDWPLEPVSLSWVTRLQIAMAAAAALFLLLFGLNRLALLPEPKWLSVASPAKIPGFQRIMHSVMKRNRILHVYFIGLMLGLLPCGLSYAAFARSLAAGSTLRGGLLALMFGLGTLPGLLVLGTGIGALLRSYREQTELVAGLIMIGMAVMLMADVGAAIF